MFQRERDVYGIGESANILILRRLISQVQKGKNDWSGRLKSLTSCQAPNPDLVSISSAINGTTFNTIICQAKLHTTFIHCHYRSEITMESSRTTPPSIDQYVAKQPEARSSMSEPRPSFRLLSCEQL